MFNRVLLLLLVLITFICIGCSNTLIQSDKLGRGDISRSSSEYSEDLGIVTAFANNSETLKVELKYNPTTEEGKDISRSLQLWFNFDDENERVIGVKPFGGVVQKSRGRLTEELTPIKMERAVVILNDDGEISMINNKIVSDKIKIDSKKEGGIKRLTILLPFKELARLQNIDNSDQVDSFNICLEYRTTPDMGSNRESKRVKSGSKPRGTKGISNPRGGSDGRGGKKRSLKSRKRYETTTVEEWYTVKLS